MRIIWYRLPLALKIALPMALLSLLSALSIVAITQYSQQRILHERTDKLANALAARMAASAARPLVQNDALSLQATLAEFVEGPVVQRAVVFDLKQQLIATAGDESADSWDYPTTIHWQDSVIGSAVLSLRPGIMHSDYPQLGDLVLLSLILTALSAACGLWLGHRAEAVLLALTRKLSGEQVEFDYQGTDILARMLDVPPPPVLIAEPEALEQAITLMQIALPQDNDAGRQRALEMVETIGKLYGGTVWVARASAITVRFPLSEDSEGPFRAVCCAQLLQLFAKQLGQDRAFTIALAVLAVDEANNIWRTQEFIERLQTACRQATNEGALLIDSQLKRHPAIGERCNAEENTNNFWRITTLNTPYDVLLERQFATLREQITA
ncbi:MAG TPA: hypothetical protein VLC91_00910 [Spongiibacteraceae bacterium]|nr:hypothetical protein [Spongiibacteraceae bacterium]